MAGYRVFIKPSAAKELDAVGSKRVRSKLVARIRALASDPRPVGCQKLSGAERYRVRQGDYRIVYSIEDDRSVVVVVKIGHRRDVYRVREGERVSLVSARPLRQRRRAPTPRRGSESSPSPGSSTRRPTAGWGRRSTVSRSRWTRAEGSRSIAT